MKDQAVFIKVSARVRPLLPTEVDPDFEGEAIEVHPEEQNSYLKVLTSPYFKTSYKNYQFENVYDSTSSHS
jgi:hypothetical protein